MFSTENIIHLIKLRTFTTGISRTLLYMYSIYKYYKRNVRPVTPIYEYFTCLSDKYLYAEINALYV